MNEIFLLKLGEIVLKGQNRKQFESKLRQNVLPPDEALRGI